MKKWLNLADFYDFDLKRQSGYTIPHTYPPKNVSGVKNTFLLYRFCGFCPKINKILMTVSLENGCQTQIYKARRARCATISFLQQKKVKHDFVTL